MTTVTWSPRAVTVPSRSATARERTQLRRVRLAWMLLVLNVLTFYGGLTLVVPVPSIVGKALTQGALIGALLLALSARRPLSIRPSVFLFLLSLFGVEAVLASLRAEFLLGAIYRVGRLSLFVVVLWLLTPWWGRRDLPLLKAHQTALWTILGTVVVGLAIAPEPAMEQGRLTGVLWPIPPTQVAHYAALASGLACVLWLSGLLRRELALLAVLVAGSMLILTHTRTALVAMVVGLLLAGFSLFTAHTRVRKAFAAGFGIVAIGALTVAPFVATWLARGQSPEDVAALTGRTAVWEAIFAEKRSTFELIFGLGLTNKSYNGLPIDSNWVATYHDQGLLGAVLNAVILLFLFLAAAFRPQGPERALALFLISYAFVASFTETGLSDASPYLLQLALAASLIMSPPARPNGGSRDLARQRWSRAQSWSGLP